MICINFRAAFSYENACFFLADNGDIYVYDEDEKLHFVQRIGKDDVDFHFYYSLKRENNLLDTISFRASSRLLISPPFSPPKSIAFIPSGAKTTENKKNKPLQM